jgi:parallel beta-helix repeat protein
MIYMYRRIAAIWFGSLLLLCNVVILIEIAEPVRGATTIYVDDDGGMDYTKIQDAINASQDGDTVFVYSGTYNEDVRVNKSINLMGESQSTTTINGTGDEWAIIITEDFVNISGFKITGSGVDASGLRLERVMNCRVYDNTIFGNDDGIYLFEGSFNKVFRNDVYSNSNQGIFLFDSTNNDISSNFFYSNSGWGILLGDLSADNTVTDNIVVNNTVGVYLLTTSGNNISRNELSFNTDYGIFCVEASNNMIFRNNISSNNGSGLAFSVSSNSNTLIENDIYHNTDNGIFITVSSNNIIYHNNIANSSFLASDNGINIWDDGYPSGGNYWSDYTGSDEYNGPNQDQPGSDGIGDTEYDIDFNSQDNYPLMNPISFDISPPNIISGPHVVLIGDTWATIEWETDEPSDSVVEYGYTTNYGNEVWKSTIVTSHSIDLTGLDPSTLYHFRVKSKDQSGNVVISGDFTFTTNPTSKPVHNLDKNTYYDTIQEGIDDADSGDTIFVNSGIYYEDIIIDKILTLTGEDRENTVINGSGSSDVIFITADWVTISGFSITGSGSNMSDAAIKLQNNQNCKIDDNIIFENTCGIDINYSHYTIITNNYISLNGIGIFINSSVGNTIGNNEMISDGIFITGDTLEFWNSHDIDTSNTVNGKPVYYWKNINNGIIPQDAGQVILANSNNVIIENQAFINCTVGIELGFSDDNEIKDNAISENSLFGLYVTSSHRNTITDNAFSRNGFSMSLDYSNENDIIRNQIFDSAIGIIVLASEMNTVVTNNIYNNDNGIMLVSSKGNTIEANFISNEEDGIWVVNSNETIIRTNNITNHVNGIWILLSDACNISDNSISDNGIGIYLWFNASWNSIINNTISNNNNGIILGGFIVVHPENNMIYHNSFIDNINQAVDGSINGNQWDKGYPSGGNYWYDYSGSDNKNGPNQDISGYDGIGDTPYEIDSDSHDNYPLIKPWGEDFTLPSIELISPSNNAVIKQGTIIDLSISDSNLDKVMYSINEGPYEDLLAPYDLDTNYWKDENYKIHIQAEDATNNINTATFNFIVDSTPPSISLESPTDGSFIGSSQEIDLVIIDKNLDEVLYSVNSGSQLQIYDPYIIDGSDWPEGQNSISIYAIDKAGNSNDESFVFFKDISPPEIILNSPANGSILGEFSTINFDISDENLNSVSYSINQGFFQTFEDPYDLEPADWDDGEYIVIIRGEDGVGNVNEKWYLFRKDTTSPSIESTSITENELDVDIDTQIVIEFTEPMDTDSVESSISVSPYFEFTCLWSDDNKTLTITCEEPLEYKTLYTIFISTKAKDLAGQGLESKYELGFTTIAKPKGEEGSGFPVIYLILIIMIIVISIIVAIVVSKRKKEPVGGTDTELLSRVTQAPQTMQFTCSRCNNLLQVMDNGVTQNVTCLYCSSPLTVPSQKTIAPIHQGQSQVQSQFQQSTIQISCPKCNHNFSVVKTGSPIYVQCPNCKTQGTLR